MATPTAYGDLNELLGELVAGARAALGASFVGAYLQGSFALGAADEHSDVDFVVVTAGEVSERQLTDLQVLHARLHSRDTPWAKHLEGSYIPRRRLRHVDRQRRPILYLDNGAEQLVRDPHCNTAFVRWILRDHGIVLAGPAPANLVAPVAAEDLRREAVAAIGEYGSWARAPGDGTPMSQWKQTYLVLTFCRCLHTIATGSIGSKRAAAEWAALTLDPEWKSLIRRAIFDRADPWGRVIRPADTALVERTLAFAAYAANMSEVARDDMR